MNIESRALTGVVIAPGHGGDDPGATGNNQYEKDYTLKISKYMYDRLKELGIPVTLTRDTDITLSPTDRVNKILSACSTRNIGIIVAEDEHKNWAVIRIKQNNAENDIEYCKLIFCSKDLNLTTPTELKNQLSGDKVSTVLTWETEDNIKLYIADGEHFMKIINVAEADDEINANNFGNV